ncbi:hypothetical protein JTE90_023252 [Oedothorax gibbosus]|uniref:LYR motif-containing protein 2 n=1 Tax=Oedothorax gibbosus TaxID=931172 RepID=A0AAV6U499_9ARAC|nr:hypothetical protein JTE90_023252 [Oedothorax gibbosus]
MSTKSKDVLSLSQFLLRSKSLNLYRDILRTTKRIPNKEYQTELRQFVRQEFENNRQHKEEEVIKSFLNRGRQFHEELLTALSLSN